MNFYKFNDKNYRSFRVTNLNDISSDEIYSGDFICSNPLEFKYYVGGATPYDIIATGWVGIYLISYKTIDLLIRNNIRGWKVYPTIVFDKKNNVLNNYSVLTITGKCGSIDWSKSYEFQKQLTPTGQFANMLRGIHFDYNEWDGSDIFIPKGSKFILVTERVKILFELNKISNAEFKEIESIELLKPSNVT
jgi:hypothetical protein